MNNCHDDDLTLVTPANTYIVESVAKINSEERTFTYFLELDSVLGGGIPTKRTTVVFPGDGSEVDLCLALAQHQGIQSNDSVIFCTGDISTFSIASRLKAYEKFFGEEFEQHIFLIRVDNMDNIANVAAGAAKALAPLKLAVLLNCPGKIYAEMARSALPPTCAFICTGAFDGDVSLGIETRQGEAVVHIKGTETTNDVKLFHDRNGYMANLAANETYCEEEGELYGKDF